MAITHHPAPESLMSRRPAPSCGRPTARPAGPHGCRTCGGPAGSNPHNFVTAGGLLYFIASGTNDATQELYRTDGTPGGTVLLKSEVSLNPHS